MTSTVKINDKVIAIEPMVPYQRMIFVKKDSNDSADNFKYELAPYPLAGMRKTVKSVLYEEFSIVDYQELANTDRFVIDVFLSYMQWIGKKNRISNLSWHLQYL